MVLDEVGKKPPLYVYNVNNHTRLKLLNLLPIFLMYVFPLDPQGALARS